MAFFYLAWVLNWLISGYTLKVIKETAYESQQKFNCEHNSCWKLLDSECIIFCLFLLFLFVYPLSLNHHRSDTGFKWSCRNQAWLYGKAMSWHESGYLLNHTVFLHESALRRHETSEFGYRNRIFLNRSPERFEALSTRIRTKHIRFQKCLDSFGHSLSTIRKKTDNKIK